MISPELPLKKIIGYTVFVCLICFMSTCCSEIPTSTSKDEIGVEDLKKGQLISSMEKRADSQILFGDLHVHTTLSVDAFMWNLPALGGRGVNPISDACNFARFCSAIDFFSSTDHAESLTFEGWNKVKEEIRECNASAGRPEAADLIAFSGFEWTQITNDAKSYYGHKNVIFKYTDEDRLPVRAISSWIFPTGGILPKLLYAAPLLDPLHPLPYLKYAGLLTDLAAMDDCPSGVNTKDLPATCREMARTASDLFAKLDEWGLEALVIPHGTAWGLHVPPDVDYISQLPEHDSRYQRLIEIYSGHGNSEKYKDWKAVDFDEKGNRICPPPTDDYLPCCWQAGEIVRKRCMNNDNGDEKICEESAEKARRDYLMAGYAGSLTIAAAPEEWLDCGLCVDCFKPALDLVPAAGVQRILAASMENDDGEKKAFKLGVIGSTDTHKAKPGHGYAALIAHTDASRGKNALYQRLFALNFRKRVGQDFERNASYWYTGGLAAVHAKEKTREAIWEALVNRNTYGTSGPRILLWFDLLNNSAGNITMGSEAVQQHNPTFRAKAVGSPKMLPGCPKYVIERMGEDFIQDVCNNQCYNPSKERYRISRIEIVKIQQQTSSEEDIGLLINDPFKVYHCPEDSAVCEYVFTDDHYFTEKRSAAYYARIIQEETESVNANNVKCEYDENGKCLRSNPCNPLETDCMGGAEERAWSSPIFLDPNSG